MFHNKLQYTVFTFTGAHVKLSDCYTSV